MGKRNINCYRFYQDSITSDRALYKENIQKNNCLRGTESGLSNGNRAGTSLNMNYLMKYRRASPESVRGTLFKFNRD